MIFFSPTLKIFCCITIFALITLAFGSETSPPPTYLRHQRRALEKAHLYKRQNASSPTQSAANMSSSAIQDAEKIVAAAVAQQGAYNTFRVANPRLHKHYFSNSDEAIAFRKAKRETEPTPPSLDNVREAAALLAEHTASQKAANGTLHRVYQQPKVLPRFDDFSSTESIKRASTDYWLGSKSMKHNGLAPMGANSSWLVYRDVTDTKFAGGAKGDGLKDDTAAINAAIAYGGNCGRNCLSSSIKGTLIYFPPGTYLISSPIIAYYYAQLIGNPNDLPIIKTSKLFIGLGAIETDVYEDGGNGGQWYINQSNFFRQVRNFIIDVTDTATAKVAGLHWQVAQATSLMNCYIYASEDKATTAMGMFTENGSSGFMGDCAFFGGAYGLYGGNQQYTVRGFEFFRQTKASIVLLWDWGWTWSGLFISDTPIGIQVINPEATAGQQAGSIYVMDTFFSNVATAIYANHPAATVLKSSVIVLDNIGVTGVTTMVGFSDGNVLAIPAKAVDFIIIGNVEADGANYGMYSVAVQHPDRSLTGNSNKYARDGYFYRSRPQYQDIAIANIVNVKDHGAKGDGVTDDTAAIGSALQLATKTNLIYFPAGSYIITSTLVIHPGTRITGEVWSQLVASGSYFADMSNPHVMLRVGSEGSVGSVEISDMLFASVGNLPGLVMVEWNMAPESQGSVALWDTHFRVGGAIGTKLQVANCLKTVASVSGCMAASMMLHITSGGSGYFENMWAWIADHDLDDAKNTMISVAVARGILVESQGPTWLLGTASEHAILYQYNFFGSTNTWAGMIQTESPYFQYTPGTKSPAGFDTSIGVFNNDPVFPDPACTASSLLCDFSWAVMIGATTNLTIAGAGLYSWFDNYEASQACVDSQNCQQRLVSNQGGNSQLLIWNLVTIGAVEMISEVETGSVIYAHENTQAIGHPFWSILGAYLDDSSTEDMSVLCDDDDFSAECLSPRACDFTRDFQTIEALAAAAGTFPEICTDYYALGVLGNLLNSALANYSSANSGYDGVFDDYVKYTKEMVPEALAKFMAHSTPDELAGGPGNKYFSCKFVETAGHPTPIYYNPCPPPWNQYFYINEYSLTYTLNDEAGFFAELASTYGIPQSWVKFGTISNNVPCTDVPGNGRPDLYKRCEAINVDNIGVPMSGNVTVSNPKELITRAMSNIEILKSTITARKLDLDSASWFGPTDDIVQTLSLPVFMIVQAVAEMAEVKRIGKAAAKAAKIQLVLEILGILFIFIPFLDFITPEIKALDGIFNIIAAGGGLGLTIKDIIDHPENAPMDILATLTGGVGRKEDDFKGLAATRRGISDGELMKIGTKFKNLNGDLQAVLKRSCPA